MEFREQLLEWNLSFHLPDADFLFLHTALLKAG